MRDYKSLSHTRWVCKYHIVFIPKKRQKVIFCAIRKHLGDVFHELALRQGIVIEEGHLCTYVPQYSSQVVIFTCSWLHERKKCYIDSQKLHR